MGLCKSIKCWLIPTSCYLNELVRIPPHVVRWMAQVGVSAEDYYNPNNFDDIAHALWEQTSSGTMRDARALVTLVSTHNITFEDLTNYKGVLPNVTQ